MTCDSSFERTEDEEEMTLSEMNTNTNPDFTIDEMLAALTAVFGPIRVISMGTIDATGIHHETIPEDEVEQME